MMLSDGTHAYGCGSHGSWIWIYDFVTDKPTKWFEYFAPSHWRWPFLLWDLEHEVVNVTKIELSAEAQQRPNEYTDIYREYEGDTTDSFGNWGRLTVQDPPHRVDFDKGVGWKMIYRCITANEIGQRHKRVSIGGDLIQHVQGLRDQMELIHVPDKFMDTKALAAGAVNDEPDDLNEPEETEGESPTLFEIIFKMTQFDMDRRHAIEDALNEALLDAELGLVMGAGADLDSCDVVVETEPRLATKTLRVIRRVLGDLMVPASTRIRQTHGDDEAIEHPLKAPRSGRTKSHERHKT